MWWEGSKTWWPLCWVSSMSWTFWEKALPMLVVPSDNARLCNSCSYSFSSPFCGCSKQEAGGFLSLPAIMYWERVFVWSWQRRAGNRRKSGTASIGTNCPLVRTTENLQSFLGMETVCSDAELGHYRSAEGALQRKIIYHWMCSLKFHEWCQQMFFCCADFPVMQGCCYAE